MKKILTLLAVFMALVCGSTLLVSCSKDYKKMYLTVEYFIAEKDGADWTVAQDWTEIENGQLDFSMSNDGSRKLYLRIKVNGTSKKVNSLYISQSENTAIILENTTVKPNQVFEAKVNTMGSVRYSVIPSEGGEDKTISFGINVYKELESIEQSSNCVPAVVKNGNIELESLTNLIKYYPYNESNKVTETNQTGVNFSLVAVGSLINDGGTNLISREFVANANYEERKGLVVKKGSPEELSNIAHEYVKLDLSTGKLRLTVSSAYDLTSSNNVIKLKATSKFHNGENGAKEISTFVYAYIVENFSTQDLLVSYNSNEQIVDGNLPESNSAIVENDEIKIYNSVNDGLEEDVDYNHIEVYTYIKPSIYSFESNPGMKLSLIINGQEYNYRDVPSNLFGIQVSPIIRAEYGVDKLVGLKFEVNPNSMSQTNVYNIELGLGFNAFDFSASDKNPDDILKRKFTLTVQNLVSGFNINGVGYSDNSVEVGNGNIGTITAYGSAQEAKLYTTYSSSAIGMPLNIQPTPTNAINDEVYVSFYTDSTLNTKCSNIQVMQNAVNAVPSVAGEFKIDFINKDRVVYLRFSEAVGYEEIYMKCRAVCTPDKWLGEDIAEQNKEYIEFVAKITVVGAVDQMYIYKTESEDGINDTFVDEFLAVGEQNIGYLGFSTQSTAVNYKEITITSNRGNIKFSNNGTTWVDSITADMLTANAIGNRKLYFKTESACVDSVVITSNNGVTKTREYEFVNAVSGAGAVSINFDKTYVWQSEIVDQVGLQGVTDDIELKYLALQSSRNVQFVASGDNKNNTIESVEAKSLMVSSPEYLKITKDGTSLYQTAISSFSTSAIKLTNVGSYLFDVSANSVGFTSILFVKVDFYAMDEDLGKITLQSKYFVYEVAVYTPARELRINTNGNKDSILYINENYLDVATVNFTISLNNATRVISFSSSSVNDSINVTYGEAGTKSIYGVRVTPDENVDKKDGDDNNYFEVVGLNSYNGATFVKNSEKIFSLKALQRLDELQAEGVTSVSFEIAIYQFGRVVETSKIKKVIYFGNYEKAENIVVVSGVESYNNIYLSLINGEVSKDVVAYSTSSLGEVTYKELGCELKKADATGNLSLYDGDDLEITRDVENDTFKIIARNNGGVYQLRLYTKDSYGTDNVVEYKITINVSDGKTKETAYLISTVKDFESLAENTSGNHYRLRQDIDISSLGFKVENGELVTNNKWWEKSRAFDGHLYGDMTITDPNTGNTIQKNYALINLTITEGMFIDGDACFGLFTAISATGSIENVIFDNVSLEINLDNVNTPYEKTVNIGVIASINNGAISNCSVYIKESKITFNTTDDDSAVQSTTYNIGLIAGLNKKTITYTNSNSGSNYSHMVDSAFDGETPGKLNVIINKGENNLSGKTINIGGVAGTNASAGTISADYTDGSSKSVAELIGVIANIEYKAEYDNVSNPIKIHETAIGGIAGLNAGTIKNIAVSGSVVAYDKANIGGIAGQNTGTITEVANYGANIEGKSSGTMLAHYGTGGNQEQNIGGIVGYNTIDEETNLVGIVDNVRVLFIEFANSEVSVSASIAQIKGVGNVAGIIGRATNTQLTRAFVENFVIDEEEPTYNIIGVKANVAGFIADSTSSSVGLSFIQADFSVENSIFYEFGKGLECKFVYFIGDVLGDKLLSYADNPTEEIFHNTIDDNTYIIKYVVNADGSKTEKKPDEDDIPKASTGYVEHKITALNGKAEYLQWRQSDEDAVNNKNPYLIYYLQDENGNVNIGGKKHRIVYTITVKPTDIIVNVDQDYFTSVEENVSFKKYDDGIYLEYEVASKKTSTAIVYYIEGGNNTHKLVTEGSQKGLIEKAVLPQLPAVNGSYAVNVISGSNIATLTDGDSTITFSGVGKVELRFTSLFDRNIQADVTIFVENPLSSDVFSLTTGAGLEDRTQEGNRFATMVGKNSILSLNLNNVDGQASFDSAKTYMQYAVDYSNIKINGVVSTAIANYDALREYFTITADTESNENILGRFNLAAIKLEETYNYIEIPITLSVHLKLDSYKIGNESLSELITGVSTQLAAKPITIVIYNKATSLTVATGDTKAGSGSDVTISADLITGYIGAESGTPNFDISGANREKLDLNIEGFDKVDYILIADNENAQDLLLNAKEQTSNAEFGVWDLFVPFVSFNKLEAGNGYTYKINLRLKDEYRYLDIADYTEHEWKFMLIIKADSNSSLTKTVEISFVPQQLIGLRIENYSNLVERNSAGSEFTSNESESSLIIPGESGLVKIFADYSYSYLENVVISSTRKIINGVEYFIRYQQLVYNKDTEVYQSYAGITADGESLPLRKISYIVDGEYKYDGVLFVRTILDEIVGVRETFDITVNANTYNLDGNVVSISRTKTVISQYRPGVYLNVENSLPIVHNDKQVYLVENNSNITTIVARVYGYEFNIQPQITVIGGEEKVAIVQQGEVTKDLTGAYVLRYSVAVGSITNSFAVTMTMQLIDNGNTLTDTTKELEFYPVEYILDNMYLNGEANGGLTVPINTSKTIELMWGTKNTTTNKINAINEKLNNLDYLRLFYINQTNGQGQDYRKYFVEYLNAVDTNFTIRKNNDDTYRIESLKKADSITVHFNVWYGYHYDETSGRFEVNFDVDRNEENGCTNLFTHEFRLNLTLRTTEDAPNPISTVEEFKAMSAGENYILMNDITLEDWSPLNTAIASLDGNGKLINIKSFNIQPNASLNAGVFGTISENTILKNVAINIGTMENNLGTAATALYINDDSITASEINFGILAGENNGLIYNCEIVSINTNRTLEIVIGKNYDLTFGGLIGVNNGNITNSRVGTEYFERLEVFNDEVSSAKVPCGRIYFRTQGIVAGFVGENSNTCIISSSFVANTSVENTSNSGDSSQNRTAGFVATNAGTIAYSYVKGYERNILATKSTTNGTVECVIFASGAGSVAGFAYMNTGTIHDCYTNTICKSNSAGVAGFVYNTVNGSVYQAYSASRVESGSTTALATELPFVGVGLDKSEAQNLLTSKNVVNCYYLDDGTEYDTNYNIAEGVFVPKGLKLDTFAKSNNLNNFSFIENGNNEQEIQGVWTYRTSADKNRSTYSLTSTALPELTGANTIARSIRVFKDASSSNSEIKTYKYPLGYEPGNKNNPHIIRSAEEYTEVFVDNAPTNNIGKKYLTGYVRFIDDISFVNNNEYIDIDTRSNYILGDKNERTLTVIDGNGMTISGIIINYSEDEKGNLGLFSDVYSSVIKGLTLEYSTIRNSQGEEQVGSSTATCVGGVAGTAHNLYAIDLTLSGNVTLRAHNVVGGVVGKISGKNSGILGVSSALKVQAGYRENSDLYVIDSNQDDLKYLSYAGGIAGIIDIGQNLRDTTNINKITVNSSSVRANRAGGIAGFMGPNVVASRLNYVIGGENQIFGREVAGGIVADSYAKKISLSQVNHDVNTQYEYDKAFGNYINQDEELAIDNTDSKYGYLHTITGQKIVGGFIGVHYGGDIDNSLTKANIGHNAEYGLAETVGGFIGKSHGGNLESVYAQNYIELYYKLESIGKEYTPKYAGGLIGSVEDDSTLGLSNVVTATWFDKDQINKFNFLQDKLAADDVHDDPATPDIDETKLLENNIYVDYVVGDFDKTKSKIVKESSATSSKPIVNYGVFNADGDGGSEYKDGIIKDRNGISGSDGLTGSYDMEALYYVPTGDDTTGISTQQDIFNTLFAVWSETYWTKDYAKFMPNLKLDDSTNYIVIDSDDDIDELKRNPDGNFILREDVAAIGGNYIADIDFRGVLIGTLKDDDDGTTRYTKITITLDAKTSVDPGAGFFRSTTGARIANIGFDYSGTLNLRDDSDVVDFINVGGISAKDENSRFEQVTVSGKAKGETVTNFGSLISDAKQSQILSCNSNLIMELKTTNSSPNIGGLVGILKGYKEPDENGNPVFEGLISSSKYSGEMAIKGDGGITVGGIVAHAEYTRISDCIVAKDYAEVEGSEDSIVGAKTSNPVAIKLSSKNSTYVGGIAGSYENCSIAGAWVNVSVQEHVSNPTVAVVDNIPNTTDTMYVGGIVGSIRNSMVMDRDIERSYAKVEYAKNANTAHIGGIVGEQRAVTTSQDKKGVELKGLLTEVNIKREYGGESISVDRMIVGGIVALTTRTTGEENIYTTINDGMAIIDADTLYTSVLIGGGLIGQASQGYAINNSTATGSIWANQDSEFVPTSTSSLTVLGGMVGLAGKERSTTLENTKVVQKIVNSYTTLTLSTAGIYQGDNEGKSHTIYKNSIVGYTDETQNRIEGSGILYSSDYTLALESVNENKFTSSVINVTAGFLVNADQTLKGQKSQFGDVNYNEAEIKGHIGDKWLYGKEGDLRLPMPIEITDLLVSASILEYIGNDLKTVEKTDEDAVNRRGQSYAPKIIKDYDEYSNSGIGDNDYHYYVLLNDLEISSVKNMTGILLGNNKDVIASCNLFDKITIHSAISNLSITLDIDGISTGAVTKINNGTIFMCGVNYEGVSVTDGFAGIAHTNNGTISYCYNTGNAIISSGEDFSGLVQTNEINATIENSYFTGSFVKDDTDESYELTGYGLVGANGSKGYISNSYSAGMVKVDQVLGENGGRYSNVKYDYYASYVTTTYANSLPEEIVGLATIGLQEANGVDSTLFAGWKVYSMHNLPVGQTTYNYGYPIHNIPQKALQSVTIDTEYKVKPTGNGTFEKIVDEDTGFDITSPDTALERVKGKLVKEGDPAVAYYDNNSYLINNLGVLSLIDKIKATDEAGNVTEDNSYSPTYGKYFELEINIIMPSGAVEGKYKEDDDKLLSAWKGLGTSNHPFRGVFTTSAFKDIDIYELDTTLNTEADDVFKNNGLLIKNEAPKTVKNLTGGALFANVANGALIANIHVESSFVATAPLVNKIILQGNETELMGATIATIYNIKVNGLKPNNAGISMAGFVNNIGENEDGKRDAKLNIYNISQDINIVNNNNGARASNISGVANNNYGTLNIKKFSVANIMIEEADDANVAGFIHKNAGTINFAESMEYRLEAKASAAGKQKSISGFVYNNSGDINSPNGITIELAEMTEKEREIDAIAGFAHTLEGGTLSNITINFSDGGEGNKYGAKIFGGVVDYMKDGTLGTADNAITVQLSTATAGVFGGVAGKVEGGSISNVTISTGEQLTVTKYNEKPTDMEYAYGLVIGHYAGKLNEINYTLSNEISFKVNDGINVGGIIGYATNAQFVFTGTRPAIVKVYGYQNVGGFIGQYCADDGLSITGSSDAGADEGCWIIDGKEAFASINIAIDVEGRKSSRNTSVTDAQNFGGLFGWWNSKVDFGSDDIKVINMNTVLCKEDVLESYSTYLNNSDKAGSNLINIIVSNIGGVFGKINSSINNVENNAKVGMEITADSNVHDGKNPIYGTTNLATAGGSLINLGQFKNVGGIAGCAVRVVEDLDEETSEVVLKNISIGDNSEVYGSYCVGGIVGYGSIIKLSIESESATEPVVVANTVIGLKDVGGVIGYAQNLELYGTSVDWKVSLKLGKVAGIVNVGGVIGSSETVTIQDVLMEDSLEEGSKKLSEVAVIGNLNVGGLIGYSTKSTLTNISIERIEIYGSVFDYVFNERGTKEARYFLPTNIGGVAGVINATDTTINAVATQANVKTDDKFSIGEEQEVVANQHYNYLGLQSTATYSASDFKNYLLSNFKSPSGNRLFYSSVEGGIGGFVGTLNGDQTFENCSINGDVYAPIGINVGGIVGYLDANPQIIVLPVKSTSEAINVAGKIFVGGYIGKSNAFEQENGAEFFTNNEIIKVNVQKYVQTDNEGNIQYNGSEKVLRTLQGNVIGGVIGYVTGNVYKIKLEGAGARDGDQSKIKIYNTTQDWIDSTYVGTLVGRIDGYMSGCKVDSTLCDAVLEEDGIYYTMGYMLNTPIVNGIIRYPKVYNYGGLVGLVDVKYGKDVKVYGEHYYPFTVEMVQNRDYAQGVTKYNYEESSKNLIAIAHYVNTTNIDISVSCLTGLYNGKEETVGGQNIGNDYNPTNTDASGWAKEYTLFRTMARVIDQSEPTGNAVQLLYNAEYITGVNTTYEKLTEGSELQISKDIIYTIYQPPGQEARLYCKYGIAKQKDDFDTKKVKIVSSEWDWGKTEKAFEKNYPVDLSKSPKRGAFWQHIESSEGLGIDSKDPEKIEKSYNDEGQVKYQFKSGIAGEADKISQTLQKTFGYTYYEKTDYMGDDSTYFIFETVFGNVAVKEDVEEGGITIEKRDEDSSMYSNSGSIFEVTGTSAPIQVSGVEDDQKWLAIFVEVVVWILIIVLEFASWGALPALEAKLLTMGGKLAHLAWKATASVIMVTQLTTKAKVITSVALALVSLTGAGLTLYNTVSHSYVQLDATYDIIEDVSSGYLMQGYGHSISWQEGEMLLSLDGVMPIPITAELTSEDSQNWDNKLNAVGSNTYEKFLINDIVIKDDDNKVATKIDENGNIISKTEGNTAYAILTLNYYSCATSRAMPADINADVTVTVQEAATDTQSKLLRALGVKSYKVPKYVSYNNELYAYGENLVSGRRLKPNIDETKNEIPSEAAVIEVDGVAYIVMPNDNPEKYGAHIIDVESNDEDVEEYVFKNYGLHTRINNKVIECVISSIGGFEQINLENMKWNVVDTNSYVGELAINTTLKYAGTTDPGGFRVERFGRQYGSDIYYYNNGNYYSVANNAPAPSEGAYNTIKTYFTKNGTGTATINVLLKPAINGNITYADLDNAGLAPTGKYYYKYDETAFNNEKVLASFKFGMSKYFSLPDPKQNEINVYTYESLGKNKNLQYIPITLYKFNPDPENPDSIEDFFDEETKTNLAQILNDWDTYNDYSISNQCYIPVNGKYDVRGEVPNYGADQTKWEEASNLFAKIISNQYLMEEKAGVKFVYSPIYGNGEIENNFANKYVYNVTIDGKTVKLYTRFNYNYSGSNFLEETVITKTVYCTGEEEGHNGDHTEGNVIKTESKEVGELLLPPSASGHYIMDSTFSEGCRITLSPHDSTIYMGYREGKRQKYDSSTGKISANYAVLNTMKK